MWYVIMTTVGFAAGWCAAALITVARDFNVIEHTKGLTRGAKVLLTHSTPVELSRPYEVHVTYTTADGFGWKDETGLTGWEPYSAKTWKVLP